MHPTSTLSKLCVALPTVEAAIVLTYIGKVNTLRQLRALFFRLAPPAARVLPWLGAALMLVAAGFAAHSWLFAQTQQRALATVTEDVSSFAAEGGVRFSPRLRFRTANGTLEQVQTAERSEEVEFAAGDIVPVLFPPGRPDVAIIATPWRAYRAAIVLGILGVVLFDLGLILRLVLRVRAVRSA